MPVNRKLSIKVTFTCNPTGTTDFGGSAVYEQTASTPNMGTIVDSNGEIHLAASDNPDYNDNVDIEFTLVTPSSGTVMDVAWATQFGAGMTIVTPDGGSNTEMSVEFDSSTPNLITIVDKDDDSNIYNYKPAVELIRANHPNYRIGLDPKIVNRPHKD